MNENRSQLKIGALISYLQMGLGILISLVYTPVMIRLLGQSEYGLYNTVASTISMLSILRLGFNNSYIRYYAKYRKKNDMNSIYKLNGVFIVLFGIIGLISLVCGIYLSFHLQLFFSNGLTNNEYKIAKVLMFLLTVNLSISFPMSVFSNIISANEKFVILKGLEILKTVVGPMVTLPLLLLGKGSIGMVTVTLIISLVVDACYLYYVLCVLKNRFIFKSPENGILKDLVIYTSFIAAELIVDQINWNIDKMLLARYKGTIMVAVYSVGFSLYTYYQSFSTAISGVFTPRVHKIVNADLSDYDMKSELTALFVKIGRIQFLLLALIATGILFFGKYFITRIWAGQEYIDAYYVALLLIIPASIALIQNVGIEIQRALYKHKFRSIAYTVMALFNLIMSVILCQLYGAIGSAIGTAFSLIVANGIIMNIYYHKACNLDIICFWKNILKLMRGLIAPVVIGIIINAFIKTESVFCYLTCIAIYSLMYIGSMWMFGMNNYEKNLVKSLIRKVVKK